MPVIPVGVFIIAAVTVPCAVVVVADAGAPKKDVRKSVMGKRLLPLDPDVFWK